MHIYLFKFSKSWKKNAPKGLEWWLAVFGGVGLRVIIFFYFFSGVSKCPLMCQVSDRNKLFKEVMTALTAHHTERLSLPSFWNLVFLQLSLWFVSSITS